jgi:perosamine synthetase
MTKGASMKPLPITRPRFDEAEIEHLRRCLDSGWVTQGPMTREFEERVASIQGVDHALATTSCTAALHLATLALGLGPGDEVVIPAFTWITSANAAEYVGAKAVFADVDPETFNLAPASLEAAITPRTRAIVAVHLFGLAAPMDEILAIASKNGIAVIEDAACAIGTTYRGRPVGGIGSLGCFSFHPRKVVTTGEGGMVTTNDARLAEKVASYRNHGTTGTPSAPVPWGMNEFGVLGFNLRLSDIQAAVGLAQIDKLPELLAERRAVAHRYDKLLAELDALVLPLAGDRDGHTYQSYVVRLREGGASRRNAVMTALAEADIQSRPGTHAVHRLGYYRDKYGLRPEQFPSAAECEDTTITLPLFPGMELSDQERVASVLREGLAKGA